MKRVNGRIVLAAAVLLAGCGGSTTTAPLSGSASASGVPSVASHASPDRGSALPSAPSSSGTAIDPTPFPPTGVAPVVPAGWASREIPHLGLRVALPADWHVVTPADRSDESLVGLDLDTYRDITVEVGSPALATSIISSYGLIAVAPDRTGLLVLEVKPASMRDNDGAVSIDSPAGAAKLDETPSSDVIGLVRIQPDWSLAVSVRTAARTPEPARDLAREVIGSIEAIGPPATTVGHLGPDPNHPLPDRALDAWLPTVLAGRKLNMVAIPGRFVLAEDTIGKRDLLGNGNLFDVCLSMASTVDEIALGLGGLAPETGKASTFIFVCRADHATNEGWIEAIARLLPKGAVRATTDRPIWHATSTRGNQNIGMLAAGQVAVEVVSGDPVLVDAILGDVPPDL